jgi:peptide/nickel transport system substrate-binding protein
MVEMNVNKAPFNNRLVRWAINHAVDMQLVVDTIFAGKGAVFAGPFFPFETNSRPDLPVYERKVGRAKALLAAAGFPNGFSVILDAAGGDSEWCEAVATQLRDVGINASVKVSDRAVLLPQLRSGERQMFCNSWGSSLLDPIGYFDAKMFTPAETGLGRGNFSGFSDPEIDALIEKGATSLNAESRKMIYWVAQTKVWFEAPWIFGFTVDEVEATSARVRNLQASPDGRINLHDVWCVGGRC